MLRLGFAAATSACIRRVPGQTLTGVPAVDSLDLLVIVDNSVTVFADPVNRPDLKVSATPPVADFHTTFAAQWGYSVLARSQAHSVLIDFGYSPDALLENMKLLHVDPASIDAMVLSHGHWDHFGGLNGLLATGLVRAGTPLYIGGEEAFCERTRGITPESPSFGSLDRAALQSAGIRTVVSGDPAVIAGSGFTTGRIPFVSSERPRVPTGMRPGRNCSRDLLPPEKRSVDYVVDDAVHELGTAFHVRGRGLVVIGSCSHRGIINTVRQAQAVSGVRKVHAIVGGFHLVAPQTHQQVLDTLALMQAMDPDYIIPGHCSGEDFIQAATAAMPGKVIRSQVGRRYQFAAA